MLKNGFGTVGTRIVLCALALLLIFAACAPPRDKGMQLLLSSEELQPTTTFEVRFEVPVVSSAQAGLPASQSPLVFTPSLPGKFVWLSQRSGVFSPAEPLRLATTYHLSTAKWLRREDGKPLRASLNRTLRTPPFSIVGVHASMPFESTNLISEPIIKIEFNSDVLAESAQAHFEFRRGSFSIPAEVRHAEDRDYFGYSFELPDAPPLGLWNQTSGYLERPASSRTNQNEPRLFSGSLIVTPATALTAASDWKLVVTKGLQAANRSLRLSAPLEIPLGTVQPFAVIGVEAENSLAQNKRIAVRFSKELSPDLNASNAAAWIAVSPAPLDASWRVNGKEVSIGGSFKIGSNYLVRIRKGLPAQEKFTLQAASDTNTVVFQPIDSRLYLPAFSADQLGWGNREFEVLSINLPNFGMRAKRLDRNNLIHALRGYQSYFKRYGEDWTENEPYHALDFNVIPGKTVFDKRFQIRSRVDVSEKTLVNWDDVLGIGKFGPLFLEARERHESSARNAILPGAQAVVQLTDLGLVWKRSQSEVFAYAFSYHTGAPVHKAAVRLLTDENEVLAEAVTDESGTARLKDSAKGAWLMADSGEDLHAVQMHEYGMPLYGFNIPIEYSEDRASQRVLLFSDRPVYRPGETLHLKAICRDWDHEQLVVPTNRTAHLRYFDAKGRKFLDQTNLVLSSFGSLSASVVLPEGPLGSYRAELILDGRPYEHSVLVQEYHPNAFEIALAPKPVFAAGEKIELPVSAKYYMGKSLAKANVHWVLEAHDSGFAPRDFDEFVFCTGGNLYGLDRSSSSISLNGNANSLSNLVIAPEIPINPKAPQPRSAEVSISIVDLDQQSVSKRAEFIQHSSAFYLGFKTSKDFVSVGESLGLDVAAVAADGSPLPEPIKVRLRVSRVDWRSVRIQGAGRSSSYRSEAVITNLFGRESTTRLLAKTHQKWDWAEKSPGPNEFKPSEAGFYLLEAETTDSAGRRVLTANGVYVNGPEAAGWHYRNPAHIELTSDKKLYQAGQTASLLLQTPVSGHALVTIEREHVLRSFVTELEGNAPTIQVPLLDSDAPNVFVSVMLLRGAAASPKKYKQPEFRLGYCQLNVEKPGNKLVVELHPSTNNYLPGDYVRIEGLVNDSNAKPIPDAEVTLYAVDEGVLSLTGYSTPDPLPFFYEHRRLAVRTSLSLPNLLPEDPDDLVFANKGYLVGGGGTLNRLRKNFLACAFWNATLRTDAEGRIKAAFQAPDSLTRYRVIAVAQTEKSQFGSGESSFQVNKPIMIEPALPRFANVGDKIMARAVLLSRHAQPGEVEISLKLDATASTTNSTRLKVPLEANGSAFVEFPLEFMEMGAAKWIWTARFRETAAGNASTFEDSVQTALQVGSPVPLLREVYLARTSDEITNLLAGANPQLLEGKGSVTVSVSNTRLGQLDEAVSQLLHYPYGCVEQTSSSLLPWIVLNDLRPALPQLHVAPPEVAKAVNAGVNRLLSMQTASGGLAYWPGGKEPIFWGSAYGGMVLALAARQNATVPKEAWHQLADYLASELRHPQPSSDPQRLGDQCLALFALAIGGRPERSINEVLYQKRNSLGAQSRALLALAISESKGPQSMLKELLQSSPGPERRGADFFDCGARDAAVRLLAWLAWQPAHPNVDVLAAELSGSQSTGHWSTTQGNAWALFALSRYARVVENGLQPAVGALKWGSQQNTFDLDSSGFTQERVFSVRGDLASLPLKLLNPQKSTLFTQVKVEAWPRALASMPRQDRGFSIVRSYNRLDDTNKLLSLEDLRVGDRVLVTLKFDVRQPAHYLAIDDPLPALFEAIHPEFKSQQAAADARLAQDWVSDFHELRTDRALFFNNHIGAGSYKIQYLARVRSAGSATAPGAKIEEMYHPEHFGVTETTHITSLPLP